MARVVGTRERIAHFFSRRDTDVLLHTATLSEARKRILNGESFDVFFGGWYRFPRPTKKGTVKRIFPFTSDSLFQHSQQFEPTPDAGKVYTKSYFKRTSKQPVLVLVSNRELRRTGNYREFDEFRVGHVIGFVGLTQNELDRVFKASSVASKAQNEERWLSKRVCAALYVKAFKWLEKGVSHDPSNGFYLNPNFWK